MLAHPRIGPHLLHAMSQPKADALDAPRRAAGATGSVDLGVVRVDRDGDVGLITTQNDAFLNSEDDPSVAALETAVDLVLLDDAIRVARAARRRRDPPEVRRAADLRLRPEPHAPLLREDLARRVHARARARRAVEDVPRPRPRRARRSRSRTGARSRSIAAVESFAIGGSCQILLVMDRVIAEAGSYFNLPGAQGGHRPRAARTCACPRFVGERATRQAIFFNRDFAADSPEGRMLADEVVSAGDDRRRDRARGRRSS